MDENKSDVSLVNEEKRTMAKERKNEGKTWVMSVVMFAFDVCFTL